MMQVLQGGKTNKQNPVNGADFEKNSLLYVLARLMLTRVKRSRIGFGVTDRTQRVLRQDGDLGEERLAQLQRFDQPLNLSHFMGQHVVGICNETGREC